MRHLEPGTVFAGHVVERQIGQGGMGVVYLARHVALDVPRALKLIAASSDVDDAYRERFQREARLAARIEHPNIVPVHDYGDFDGTLYVSMRYVDGLSLKEAIALNGALDPYRVTSIVADVGACLDHAHALGIVHRDVKPANILLSSHGGRETAYLADFGLTRLIGAATVGITGSGVVLGTPQYMAPEQIRGASDVDGRADIYALGATLYEALTARPPFPQQDLVPLLHAHLTAEPPRPSAARPGVGTGFDRVVARALAKDPDRRYPFARSLADDAKVAAEATTAPTAPAAATAPTAPPTPTAPTSPLTPTAPTALRRDPPVTPEAPAITVRDVDVPRSPRRSVLAPIAVVVALILVAAGLAVALTSRGGGSSGAESLSDEDQIRKLVADVDAEPKALCDNATAELLQQLGGRSGCLRLARSETNTSSSEVSDVKVNGDTATATVTDSTGPSTVTFRKEGGEWKVHSST